MTQAEKDHKRYEKRKAEGLCVHCGKPLDRVGTYCAECVKAARDYSRETYQWCIEHHICTYCRKAPVYCNDRLCYECSEKMRKRTYTAEQKAAWQATNNKNAKMRYQERKAQGICTRCGKLKAVTGKTKCGNCLEKDKMTSRKRSGVEIGRWERLEYGYCWQCGSKDLYKGFKVCEKCYNRIWEMSRGNGGHNDYWKEQNKLLGIREGQL